MAVQLMWKAYSLEFEGIPYCWGEFSSRQAAEETCMQHTKERTNIEIPWWTWTQNEKGERFYVK